MDDDGSSETLLEDRLRFGLRSMRFTILVFFLGFLLVFFLGFLLHALGLLLVLLHSLLGLLGLWLDLLSSIGLSIDWRLLLHGLCILGPVLEVEPLGEVEIQLNGTALVFTLVRVVELHIDLGTIERTIALIDLVGLTESV